MKALQRSPLASVSRGHYINWIFLHYFVGINQQRSVSHVLKAFLSVTSIRYVCTLNLNIDISDLRKLAFPVYHDAEE